MKKKKKAVLLIFWKRTHTLKRVIESISRYKPDRIYLSCDGGDSEEDRKRVSQARETVEELVNWECQIERRYLDWNSGCKKGCEGALDWFFGKESEGIILEDDIVATDSFFYYCSEALDAYRDSKTVGIICGTSFSENNTEYPNDYRFARIGHIWGWATWSDRWPSEEARMEFLENPYRRRALRKKVGVQLANYYSHALYLVRSGRLNTWDIPFLCNLVLSNQYACIPGNNLVENIGFDAEATHTKIGVSPLPKTGDIRLPLRLPRRIEVSCEVDETFARGYLGEYRRMQMFKDVAKEAGEELGKLFDNIKRML